MSSRKYAVINSVLCFVALLIGFENYELWNRSGDLLPNAGVEAQKPETTNGNSLLAASTKESTSIESYNLIAERNIFNPERTDFPMPAPVTAETQKPVVRPQIVLYGVVIGEDYQVATVTNPERALRKEERETRTVKLGDKIGEYTLAKILPDRIMMARNEDTFEVLLDDSGNPKRKVQARAKTAPAVMANLQPAPVSLSGDAPRSGTSQESEEKPKEPVQTRIASLPFNKYTYELLGPSARSAQISRGKILYSPPGPSSDSRK